MSLVRENTRKGDGYMLQQYPKGVIIMKAIARPVVAIVEVNVVLIAFISA